MFEWFVNWFLAGCSASGVYRIGHEYYRVTILVDSVSERLGLTSKLRIMVARQVWWHRYCPSFAHLENGKATILLHPTKKKKTFYFAMNGTVAINAVFVADPTERLKNVTAAVLAHEARHIQQGPISWFYGLLMSYIAMPIIMLLPLTLVSLVIAWLIGWLPWWSTPLNLLVARLITEFYYRRPRERDARQYATEHWQEWTACVIVRHLEEGSRR